MLKEEDEGEDEEKEGAGGLFAGLNEGEGGLEKDDWEGLGLLEKGLTEGLTNRNYIFLSLSLARDSKSNKYFTYWMKNSQICICTNI